MRINVTPGKVRALLQSLGRITVQDKILADELTPDEIKAIADLFETWKTGESVTIGMLRVYNGELYECLQAHTTQSDWTPDIVPALWKIKSAPGIIPAWIQPTGAQDAYNTGDQVTFEGHIWESNIDANTWSPSVYPEGWTDLGIA
jgi:hypothetical protein